MTTCRFSLLLAAGLLVLASAASAAAGDVDPKPLTAAQTTTFLSLVCAAVHTEKRDTHCKRLIGYPGRAGADATLSLAAISFGSFSKAGADETYVTYDSSTEPHAMNFGGGILFARATSGWRLVQWFPGGQMDQCVGIPGAGRQRMLCLNGFENNGEITQNVTVESVPPARDATASEEDAQRFLEVDNASGLQIAPTGCVSGVPAGKARLAAVNSLARSNRPGFFARAAVTYEMAADIRRACDRTHRVRVHETKGVVWFRVRDGKVTTVTPVEFVPPPA